MPQLPVLSTERLLLRGFEKGDSVWLAEILSDPEVRRLTLEKPLPAENAQRAAAVLTWFRRRKAYWTITLDNEPCGFICLAHTSQFGPRGVYAGFELRRAWWGRGIATEALGAVIRCGFDAFGLDAVRAAVVEGNAASIRVLEKSGLTLGGRQILKGNRPGVWFVLHRHQAGRAPVESWRARWRRSWLGLLLFVAG